MTLMKSQWNTNRNGTLPNLAQYVKALPESCRYDQRVIWAAWVVARKRGLKPITKYTVKYSPEIISQVLRTYFRSDIGQTCYHYRAGSWSNVPSCSALRKSSKKNNIITCLVALAVKRRVLQIPYSIRTLMLKNKQYLHYSSLAHSVKSYKGPIVPLSVY